MVILPIDGVTELGPDWGLFANLYADFRYRSADQLSQDDLFALIAPYVAQPIGSQPGLIPDLDVRLLARCVPTADGRGASLQVTDHTAGIESFHCVLNGVEVGSLWRNGVQYAAPNGWRVLHSNLRWSDFNFDPLGSSQDTFQMTLDTVEDEEVGLGATVIHS
jgi:hypothetical protein